MRGNNTFTGDILKNIFKNNWKEEFVFDAINDRILSYNDFFNAILNCKKKLENFGLKKNDTICLLMPNSLDLIVLYSASLIMQMTVVPIDPKKGEDEIKEILSQVDCKIIICDDTPFDFVSKKIEINKFRDDLYENKYISISQLKIFNNLNYDRLFLISFTSGSTGIPKGVMHSFNNLVLSAIAFKKKFNLGKENIFYHNLPMTYMAGILNLIILPFISESKIVIGERFNIGNIMNFWDTPIKYSANTFWFIPTIITLLLKLDRGMKGIEYGRSHKILGCVGTAHLNSQTKKDFEDKYRIPLYESYGLSETLFVSTNSPDINDVKNSVGKPLDGVELSFMEDNEILIGVPWMFLGYSNIEKNSYLKKGKFLSGDIGIFDNNGFLMITGRKKDLIIKGGINISPVKIENFINGFNIFEEQVIIGLDDITIGEKIVCFFTPSEAFNNDKKKEINNDIIKKLGRDYCIDEFVKMDEIPKNVNGKIDKLKIKEIYKTKIK